MCVISTVRCRDGSGLFFWYATKIHCIYQKNTPVTSCATGV